jgi:hypothetical protein
MAIDRLPKDPMLLLSFVNTRLRDDGLTLDEFAAQFDVKPADIEEKLDRIGYKYDSNERKFS